MIQPFQAHTPRVQARIQESAVKFFEETTGSNDFFTPAVEDKYEDLAADFLSTWLNSSDSASPVVETTAAPSMPAPAKTQEAPAEPAPLEFTTFSLDLDWKLADEQKLR